MTEQNFVYEKKEDGICILRCYGVSASVTIPEQLEGLPVVEVSAYAFAEEMEREPENNSGFPCICGGKLEELYLPRTICRLGRYIFYNCTRFRKLSFYSGIAFMGAGAFTGCERLSRLEMHKMPGKSCLREILQDLKQKVTVSIYQEQKEGLGADKAEICRLVYPEFFEEAVENTPARIISTQTHGMGIQYRNAFRDTQVIYGEYDRLFEMGKYNMDTIILAELAAARLRFPYELEAQAGRAYARWLSEHLQEAASFILEQEDMEQLRWLAEEFTAAPEEMDVLLEASKRQKLPQAVSMVMDIKHRRFPGGRRTFVL